MKKRTKNIIILINIFLIFFVACDSKSKDTIQLWYNFEVNPNEKEFIYAIIEKAKVFCEINNITLDIVKFDDKTLSYKDYIFKRNLAAENGNMIILDDIFNLSDLDKNHANYSKLKIFNNLLGSYKNRFCIPIGRRLKSSFIDNEILRYYDIDTSKKTVITYIDYLEIKQELKKRGATFEPKNENFYETIKYFINENGLFYINKQDEILRDINNFQQALKNSIFCICEDIILYNNAKLDEFEKPFNQSSVGFEIYDSNSTLYLKKEHNCDYTCRSPIYPLWFKNTKIEDLSNKTFIVDYFGVDYFNNYGMTFSLYMYKKITNDKIYDLANYMLEQSCLMYGKANVPLYAPVFYTNKVLKELKLNENLEYVGEDASEEEKRIINATFDIFAKDEVKSKEIADAYFSDNVIVKSIETLIYDIINEIAKKLSESSSNSNLSLKNFNSEDEEINRLVDKKIDEFIKQLILEIN